MAFTLEAKAGDTQALKAIISAKASDSSVNLAIVAEAPANIFRSPSIRLVLSDQTTLTEPNAVATYLSGGRTLRPAQLTSAVDEWVEWEASVLRPATFTGATSQALTRLQSCTDSNQYLVGGVFTLADVVVYCTLLPLLHEGTLPAKLQQYMAGIAQEPLVKAAEEQVLSGQSSQIIVATFKSAAASYVSKQPKRPIPGQRNVLITSALPYVNNVPHLGNIIGCVLSADCYARYCRSRGINCIYMCGTDEYGTATETKALEEGLSCQEICDKYHAIHKGIYEWFGISFDKFGRTPTRQQTDICQRMFMDLWERGNCLEQSMEQLFSVALGKFLADRFVTGTCPKCGYEDARGDQCDNCGNLMNPTELINAKCKITGTTPVIRSTKHIFLDLPKLTDRLQEYITTTSQQGGWSANCVQTTNAWMRDGLKQRCITRDLKWGIPVPLDGFRDKVFYVWFDAPIGYISITANYTTDWQEWWQSPQDVDLVQFMGKDNVPFHTVIFPATLIGSGQQWTMMKSISVTEYLNYEGGKFSKSRGIGVFGNDARDTGIPVEVWRYYLLSNRPEQQDTDFRWSDLQARNNNELLKNLGNFINRALVFVAKFFDGCVPTPTTKGADVVADLGALVSAKVAEYVAAMDKIKIRDGIRLAMAVSADGNKFFTDTEPYKVVKTDPEHAATLVAAGVGLVRLLASLISPYMPTLTDKILAQLNLPPEAAQLTDALVAGSSQPQTLVQAGHPTGKPSPLIAEIKDDVIEALRVQFSGSQSDRAAAAAAAAASAASTATGTTGAVAAAVASTADSGKKPKGDKAAKANGSNTAAADASTAVGKGDGGKGAKGGSKGGNAGKGGRAKADKPVDVSRIDLRVGFIRKAWKHPDAESLYVEEIDVGEEQPRTVVSGLVKYIPEPDMQQRLVVLVCNLKPASMRGVLSQAMVLAASSADGSKVELVTPPEGSVVGERLTVSGYEGEPDEELKKKVFDAIQPGLATNDDCVACYNGVPVTTSKGPCTVASVAGGTVR